MPHLNQIKSFTCSAPGRVCLFGEHQDYLGMPSIVMGMNLRCRITFTPRHDRLVFWQSPALGEGCKGSFDLDNLQASVVSGEPNHKLAALLECEINETLPDWGFDAVIDSDVPVRAGCSSSSALLVVWIAGIQRLSGRISSPIELAMQAFQAEVVHFNAPGGNMDQIACALGATLRVDPDADNGYIRLSDASFDWVLGDSNLPKDTIGILRRCKTLRLELLESNGGVWDEIKEASLSDGEVNVLRGTLRNREIERIASRELTDDNQDAKFLGNLMSEHHGILRDVLQISTTRIDAMCDAALNSGALGAKIFGSGGGGCMLAMVERVDGKQDLKKVKSVVEAIKAIEGTVVYHVESEPGVSWGDGEDLPLNPVVVLAAGASSRMKKGSYVKDDFMANEALTRFKAMIRVAPDSPPFLSYLLQRIADEGSNEIVIVISERDNITRDYFEKHPVKGVRLRFIVQPIPEGRVKPEGTSHAMEIALEACPHWAGNPVTVCNGDNLPPAGSFSAIFNHSSALIAYDGAKLGLPDDRTSAFAVLDINKGGFLTQIIEKPSAQVANSKIDKDGVLRISMNIFRLPYERFLKITKACEFSEDRNERELPTAIQNFTKESPDRLFCIPYAGEFLDLTHPGDIEFVKEKLSHL